LDNLLLKLNILKNKYSYNRFFASKNFFLRKKMVLNEFGKNMVFSHYVDNLIDGTWDK